MSLPTLKLPSDLNYIAAFVTMSCNLRCEFCINDPEQADRREQLYPMQNAKSHVGLTPQQWIVGLNRIPKKADVPVTFCGGEPTIYYGGKGLNTVLNGINNYADVLTNMGNMNFFKNLGDSAKKLQRPSPYPSIRVSWHPKEMNRVWANRGFKELVDRCEKLKEYGLDISPEMSVSDAAIYMVGFPGNEVPAEDLWQGKVPFETKEYLGVHDGKTYGTYAYKNSIDLTKLGLWETGLTCKCLTRELLIDPMGFIFPCHLFLYENWSTKGLHSEFASMIMHDFRFTEYASDIFTGDMQPIGHLLDPELNLEILGQPRTCNHYGECSPCDTKLKQSHHKEGEEYTRQAVYSSVTITNIEWPPQLLTPKRIIPIKAI